MTAGSLLTAMPPRPGVMPSFGKMPESVLARNRRGGVASSGLMTKQGPESTTPAHTCIGRSRLRKAARMVIAPPMLCPTKKRGSDRHVDGMGLPTPLPPEITVSTYKSKSSVRHQCHHNRAHARVDGNIETKQFISAAFFWKRSKEISLGMEFA